MAHKFDPSHRDRLDSPERKEWQDPERILRDFGLEPGTRLADVGCGTGYFAIPAARRLGPKGCVYAIDVQEEMLWALQERLVAAQIGGVLPVLSTETAIPLPDGHVDAALLINALHELSGDSTLREIHRLLRPGGFLGVADWRKESMDRGPPVEHRLSETEAAHRLQVTGFEPQPLEVGPLHYGFKARRP